MRNRLKWLQFADVDPSTYYTFMKLFEQFGEAVPQLVIALTYYVRHTDYIWLEETLVFGSLPTTLGMVTI